MSRPALSSRRRPSSAIFLGNGSDKPPPDLPSPPDIDIGSPGSSLEDLPLNLPRTHLPSPPNTNSTGSTGARSSKGSVRIADIDMDARLRSWARSDDDDDLDNGEHDEDETARLYEDRRRSADSNDPPPASVQRVKSLTQRNRQVLDKIASLSSTSRLATASPSPHRSGPSPNATPFPTSQRISFERSRKEVEFSGSETEHEAHSEGLSSTPPAPSTSNSTASSGTGSYARTRLVSAPSPHASPKRPAMRGSTSSNQLNLSPRSVRRQSSSFDDEDEQQFAASLNRTTGPASKRRQPLPREFTASASTSVRRSLDGRSSGYQPHPQTPSRPHSPEYDAHTFSGRGSPSPTGVPATFGMSDRVSPRVQKPGRAATLRESNGTPSPLSPHRRAARWSSDLSNRIDEDTSPRSSSIRHRPQGSEDVFGSRAGSRGPTTNSATRSNQNIPSRPASSATLAYGGDADGFTRSHSRASSTVSPAAGRNSGFGSPRRSQPGQPEHNRLMGDALAMFETQLSRLASSAASTSATPTAGSTNAQVNDLLKSAGSLAQTASNLNHLLRGGTARALENQIEAEVGDAPAEVDAGEVWRDVGAEYREALRASDELVRALTGVLLGVGRVVRNVRPSGAGGSEDSGSIRPNSSLSMVRMRDELADQRDIRAERRRTEDFSTSMAAAERDRFVPRSASRLDSRRRGEQDVRTSPSPSPHSRSANLAPSSAHTESRSGGSSARRSEGFHSSPHARTLPPIAIPPPLSTLPSESLLRRRSSHLNDAPKTAGAERQNVRELTHSKSANRLNRASVGSAATIRATPAGSAATNGSSLVDERTSLGHGRNAGGGFPNSAAGSRVRGTSVTLNGLQERDTARQRTVSGSGVATGVPATPSPAERSSGNRPRNERRRTMTQMFS